MRICDDGYAGAYKYEGFWRSMDTLRDWQTLEDMVEKGDMPWKKHKAEQRAANIAIAL
ncbi:predicted protein [Brucella sp. 83/13]|nr:predicted protein [Brucella sp. 83/13]